MSCLEELPGLDVAHHDALCGLYAAYPPPV